MAEVALWTALVSLPFVALALLVLTRSWLGVDAGLSGSPLLLIAHPDDECMFFGPVVAGLASSGVRLRVLCLTLGGAAGLGSVRRRELVQSCRVLGIPADRVHVENNSCVVTYSEDSSSQPAQAISLVLNTPCRDLPDAMDVHWDPAVVGAILADYITTHSIDSIITFDQNGISSHPNHISCFNGAVHLLSLMEASRKPSDPSTPALYVLPTVPLLRKYISLFDLPISLASSYSSSPSLSISFRFIASLSDMLRIQRAMAEHQSQMVWFRRLYVCFSRYMWMNELVLVSTPAGS